MESKDNPSNSESSVTDRRQNSERIKSRTSRACDRCRVKKAKCDGRPQCKQCKISDSVCMYTARRGREAREYYSRMCKIADEAIQILFTTCRQNECFPGDLPKADEHGHTTTNAVLQALGLIHPANDDDQDSTFYPIENPSIKDSSRDRGQGSQKSINMASPTSILIDDAMSDSQVSEVADCIQFDTGGNHLVNSHFGAAYFPGPISDTYLQAPYLDPSRHQVDLATYFAPLGQHEQEPGNQSFIFEGFSNTNLQLTPRAYGQRT